MAVIEQNMRDLLRSLKALTITHMKNGGRSTNLSAIKTVKIGMLSPANTIFPAITFIPRSERLGGYRNGGVYRVDRQVDIEVYVKLGKVEDSGKHIQETCHHVKNMFDNYDDWRMPNDDEDDTVWTYSPGTISYDIISDRDTLFQRALLPYTFTSWEQAPTFTTSSTIGQYDLRTIGEYVYSSLLADSTLTNVKMFYSHAAPPVTVGNGIVLSVLENVWESNRREAGRDNPTGYTDVLIWTKASPFVGSLDLNLETVEKVKDVIQADQHMGGRCYNSYISSVQYGVNTDLALYVSRVMLETWSYKNTYQPTVPTEPHEVSIDFMDE